MADSDPIYTVLIEVQELPDGDYRVHYRGVYGPGRQLPPQKYDHRNEVQTWLNTDHDVSALRLQGPTTESEG